MPRETVSLAARELRPGFLSTRAVVALEAPSTYMRPAELVALELVMRRRRCRDLGALVRDLLRESVQLEVEAIAARSRLVMERHADERVGVL